MSDLVNLQNLGPACFDLLHETMKAIASDQICLGEEALRSAISKFPYLEQTSNLKISTGTCSIFFSSLQTSTSALERYQERVPHFPVRRYKALQQVPKGVWENSHIHSRFYSTAWHPLCTMIHRSSSTRCYFIKSIKALVASSWLGEAGYFGFGKPSPRSFSL